jgi:DNA-binding Lrp family transcriptional regulator
MNPPKELIELYERKAKHQKGFLEFSLQLRQSLLRTEMDEEKKRRIRHLMSRGIRNEREYPRLQQASRIKRRRSDRYNPAADYFRCYLSKAISNVMTHLTPRYKNEAARKEFFTKLAEITEAIHLNVSNDRIIALFGRRDSEKLTEAIVKEAMTLARSSFDPNEETRHKLTTARRELSEFISSAENLLGVKWERSEKYDEQLMLVSFFDPWHSENDETERWGAIYYSNPTVINVNPPVMCFDGLRRCVIAREAVNLLTPRIADSAHRLYEQSEYLVTKLLQDKYEKEFWLIARHGLREVTRKDTVGDLADFFSYYESFVGDDLYKQAWSRLEEMTRLSLQISRVSEYARILDAIAARPVRVKLTQDEIALFNVLSDRPNMPMSEIARRIGASIPTATKLMERLTRKACLRFSMLANDRALGLEEHLLLIKTPKPDRLPPVLWRIPYCRDIYRLYGPTDYFAVLNVPEGKGSFIHKLESALVNCGLVSEFISLEATDDYSNMSFEYFDSSESVWHVHWDTWGAGLAKALNDRKTTTTPQPFQHKIERIRFDKLDLQILERLMYNSRSSYSEIGKALGVTGAYVSRKIHQLLRNRVFRPIAKPWKTGAEEYALVTIPCENCYVEPLVEYLNKLPAWRGAAVKGGFEGILGQVGVPSGEVNQLFMTLDDRLIKTRTANCSLNVVGMWSSLRRWLPTTLYSRDEGWKFEENKYLDLVDQYGK